VLKSWQGLIYLGNERQALRSIVQALRQPIKPVIRSAIYDVLKDLLALGSKENAGVAVMNRSNDTSTQGEFKINNLLNNYLVMLV
jgi:rapamycin-insensitive companion of mTOR